MEERICGLCNTKKKVTEKEQGKYIVVTSKCPKCKLGTTQELIKKKDSPML
jgi:hypothetical protein